MVFIGGIRNITGVRERCRYPCTGSGEHKNQGGDRQGIIMVLMGGLNLSDWGEEEEMQKCKLGPTYRVHIPKRYGFTPLPITGHTGGYYPYRGYYRAFLNFLLLTPV